MRFSRGSPGAFMPNSAPDGRISIGRAGKNAKLR